MNTETGVPESLLIAAGVVALILIATLVIGWLVYRRRHSRRLKKQFGDEYERAVGRANDRALAEQQLEERLQRVHSFDLRELNEEDQLRYNERWTRIQSDFVDQPADAVFRADALLVEMMCARGYADAGEGPRRRAEDISVLYPDHAEQYRQARSIADRSRQGNASTEDLRQAMQQLRRIVDQLMKRTTGAGELSVDERQPQEVQ